MFSLTIRTSSADIDELGHVNNAVYVRWLQDIAVAHWNAVAPADARDAYLWVVSRHEVDYRAPSRAGETLWAETWGENPRGARMDRLIRIHGPDSSLRLEARTTWVMLDRQLMRPARVPPALARLFLQPEGSAQATN